MATDESELLKDLKRRRKSMDDEYNHWEPLFRDLRDNIMPTRGRFSLGDKSSSQSALNKRIVDSEARKGLRTLKSGLMAGMTSPSRPWFKLGLHNEAERGDPDVKAWLHEVQRRMYIVLRNSTIYRTLNHCYGDLGLYGTFGGLITGSFENVIRTNAFPMGQYRIAENDESMVDTLHWDLRMTVKQLVDRFGLENVSRPVRNRYQNNDLHGNIDVCAAVEVRMQRDPMSPLPHNMPIAMYYYEKASNEGRFLHIGGLGTNGVLGPRWESVEGEPWSVTSPAMDAIGDSVQLQQQHKDKAMAIQMHYKPPMQSPNGTKRLRAVPGANNTVATMDISKGGARPLYEVKPDVQWLVADINETRQRVRESFFVDLFRMTSQFGVEGVKNVTATAIAEMHEEKLIALGPVLESLNFGLLTPVVEATFHYMQEADIVPIPPESIQGSPIKVEFVSLLAQAQKAVGLAAIERTIGFVGTLAQTHPQALDKLDADAAIDEFADQVGPPPGIIRATKDAGAIREQRAQAEAQAQALEQVQPLAQSAKLLSEASERGVQGLEQAVI